MIEISFATVTGHICEAHQEAHTYYAINIGRRQIGIMSLSEPEWQPVFDSIASFILTVAPLFVLLSLLIIAIVVVRRRNARIDAAHRKEVEARRRAEEEYQRQADERRRLAAARRASTSERAPAPQKHLTVTPTAPASQPTGAKDVPNSLPKPVRVGRTLTEAVFDRDEV